MMILGHLALWQILTLVQGSQLLVSGMEEVNYKTWTGYGIKPSGSPYCGVLSDTLSNCEDACSMDISCRCASFNSETGVCWKFPENAYHPSNNVEIDTKSTILQKCISGWTTQADSDGWTMVLKARAGTGISVLQSWKEPSTQTLEDLTCESLLNPDAAVLRSNIIDQWADKDIKEVKVAMYTQGQESMLFVFNGLSSTKMNWFDKSRVTKSSYNAAHFEFNYFSIEGHPTTTPRRFFINRNYGGCPADKGWMVVIDPSPVDPCTWARSPSTPKFMYAKHDVPTVWQTQTANADVFAVYVKFN